MTTYVAFLRAINLGPTNKIAMPKLRSMAEELGYSDVATYINSGNLIFSTTKKAAEVEDSREIFEGLQEMIPSEDRSIHFELEVGDAAGP